MYRVFIRRDTLLKYSLVALVSAFVLGLVKAYILVSYLPFFILFILFTHLGRIRAAAIRVVLLFFIVVIAGLGVLLVGERLQDEMEDLALTKITESVQNTQQNFMRIADLAESSFSLGVEYDGTMTGLLRIAPAGVVATLYRPFIWESKKISSLMSSLESTALLLFTLYVLLRVGPFRFVGSIFRDPMIQFCLLFAIVFALFVGVTTLNFGTLVRYKIPCMPFYVIGLVLILERHKERKRKSAALKAAPA